MMPLTIHPVRSHFFDSGAYSLRRKCKGDIDYRTYMDRYATFIHENADGIDYYANVDVIGDPKKTWEHQRYLEKEHDLTPIPVVHFGSDLKWLGRYLDRGYQFVALGGLVGKTATASRWVDHCFQMSEKYPEVKLHGFGIVNYWMLVRYPWWSVDSAAWRIEAGRWGSIFVPHFRKGQFIFTEPPYKVLMAATATKAQAAKKNGKVTHYRTLSGAEQSVVFNWVSQSGFTLSELETSEDHRRQINLKFFEKLRLSLRQSNRSFRIYYSGGMRKTLPSDPEVLLQNKARIMLTFYEMPSNRFSNVLEARRKGQAIMLKTDNSKET